MIVDRKEFLGKMKRCLPGIDSKGALQISGSDCFLFNKDQMVTFNDWIAVSTKFDEGLQGALPAAITYKTVNAFRASELEITQDGSSFLFKCGKATAKIQAMEAKVLSRFYEMVPSDMIWKKIPDGFMEATKRCLFPNRTVYSGVFYKGETIIATDKNVLICHRLDTDLEQFWLSNQSVTEMLKFGEFAEYALDSTWAHFKTSDYVFSCRRLLDSGFPYTGIMRLIDSTKTQERFMSGELPADFITILGGASVFAKQFIQKEHTYSRISLVFRNGEVTVSSGQASGEFIETMGIKTSEFEGEISMSLDVLRLKEVLDSMGKGMEFEIVNNNGNPLFLALGNNFTEVINTLSDLA